MQTEISLVVPWVDAAPILGAAPTERLHMLIVLEALKLVETGEVLKLLMVLDIFALSNIG